jgi:PAS domain S-box-containing protein
MLKLSWFYFGLSLKNSNYITYKTSSGYLLDNLAIAFNINSMLKNIAAVLNMTEDEIRNHPHLLVNAFDQEHRVLFWNQRCEDYFGVSAEEVMGKKLEELFPSIGSNEKMNHLERALSGFPVYIADDKYDRKEGYYDQVVLPLKDADGKVFAAMNVVIDLSFAKIKKGERLSLFSNNVL